MKQQVVALVGISGVGKSTLLKALTNQVEFQHLQASALIKEARNAVSGAGYSADDLRTVDINDNQALLVKGFEEARRSDASLIVLDGHTVIDTPNGLVRIEPDVFARLSVTLFIFIADDPAAISVRRLNDQSRNRPQRSPEELDQHQEQALLGAFGAARHLNVPLVVHTLAQVEAVGRALKDAASREDR